MMASSSVILLGMSFESRPIWHEDDHHVVAHADCELVFQINSHVKGPAPEDSLR